MSFHKILVAIDNSPLCPATFAAALDLARSNQAQLKLFHCINSDLISESFVGSVNLDAMSAPTMMTTDFQTQQVLIEQQMQDGAALLKQYTEAAKAQGVVADSECLIGDAGHQLCEMARDWFADLIVVGRRGRTGLAEAFLGSVSNYVVHHAPCSVLVIQETVSAA
jgi:nucleotide-binding universal stress UspA family protein